MVTEVMHPNETEFESLLRSENLLLVDFFATWCSPCKMLSPVIEDLANKYWNKVKVVKIDIDQHPDIAGKYDVQSVPTVFLFKNGKIIESSVGFNPLSHFTSWITTQEQSITNQN